MGNEQGKLQGGPTPAGIQTMDETLQKKFSKGIQYNMKIVIRGDRNSGKTALFHRMEGKPFNEAYIPTNEIQVTSILWSYRVTNDTVKVEIWDIVDKARSQSKDKGKVGGLKMFNASTAEDAEEAGEENGQALDASFLDVYKGAHGVVFVFDIIKQWTWKYVERELPRVPLHVPIIILANFCDMHEHRLVSREDCVMAINYLERPEGAAEVRYAECSLKNGFGLMHLHKFLSVPFLQLQQETLLQQLQVNREQMLAAMEELNTAVHTEDQNYDKYMAKLDRLAEEKKRKLMMAKLQQEQLQTDRQSDDSQTSSNARQPQPATPPTRTSTTQSDVGRSHTHQPQHAAPQRSNSLSSKFSSRFSGLLGKGKEEKTPENDVQVARPSKPRTSSKTNIEEFVPEGVGVDDFLSDDEEEDEDDEEDEEDSDEDSTAVNPLIAADEDLSSPDEAVVVAPPTRNGTTLTATRGKKQPKQISFSDSEEEEEEEEEEEDQQPVILTPIKVPTPKLSKKSKQSPKSLKSAKDIELTESEEEDTPHVMADEDIDFSNKREKDRRKGQETIFEPPPVIAPKKKQAGLMLQFDPSITSARGAASKPSKPAKDSQESPKDSPTLETKRGEKKKKKSKRSSKHAKEEDVKETAKKVKETATVSSTDPQSSGDPYGAIASLDAWLNSTSNDLADDVLTPVPAAGAVEVGTEEGTEDGEARAKKAKKHRHKKHREDKHEDWEGDGEERSSSKKKHHSHHHHHKSSRHRRLEQDD